MTKYQDEREPEARAWLEKGWEWMKENPDHPRAGEFFDEWLKVLRKYEETYGMGDDDVSGSEAPAQVRMTG